MNLPACDTFYTADFYKIQPFSSAFYRQQTLSSLQIDSLPIDTTSSFIICPEQNTQYSNQEIMRLFELGRAYYEDSKMDKAKVIFDQLLLQHSIHEHLNLYSRIHNFLGLIDDISGNKLTSYFHFQTLLKKEDTNSPEINVSAYLNLGAIYTYFEDYEQAEILLKKGLAISKPPSLEYGWLLHRLGELKYRSGKYQESVDHLLKASEYWLKSNNQRSNCFTEALLGEVYSKTKSNKEAFLFLKEVLKKETDKNSLCKILVLMSLGDKCLADKQYVLALNYYKEVGLAANQKEFCPYKITAYKQMVEVYNRLNESEKAFKTFTEYTTLHEEYYLKDYKQTKLSFQRIKSQIAIEETLRLSQQKESQVTAELKLQKLVNWIGLGLLSLSTFIVWGFYFFYAKLKKRKELLAKLNGKMAQKQKDLEKANKEISYHRQELELQLLKKAMMIGKYGDTLNQVEELVKEESFHSQKDKVLHVLKDLNNDTLTEDLNLQITKANQDFFEKLSAKFPSLSQNDLRLCALLKMNLSTKEIASITYKNAQSVKVARSRLRKKLGLTHNKMALCVFLNQVSK